MDENEEREEKDELEDEELEEASGGVIEYQNGDDPLLWRRKKLKDGETQGP